MLLKDILELKRDLENQNLKLAPGLAGLYGEILVYKKLKEKFSKKGYTIEFDSGHSRADISLKKDNKEIKIEVKTSRLKDEAPGAVFGFAINIKKCEEHRNTVFIHPTRGKLLGDFCYFDFIILVCLDDYFKNSEFYIFSRKIIEDNEKSLRNTSRQFSSLTHRIIFVEESKNKEEITQFDRYLMKNKSKFRNWEIIG